MSRTDSDSQKSIQILAVVVDGENTVAVEQVELAPRGAGEVRVKVAAAGVCHSDLHVTSRAWDLPAPPMVLGHEDLGIVTAIGDGIADLEVGDHVVINWVPACGECRACTAGRPTQCSLVANVIFTEGTLYDGTTRLSNECGQSFHYLGGSTYAEQVVVPRIGAIKVRKDAPLEDIAIVGCAVMTGVGAVRNTAKVPEGATVAVIGCGGVALSRVQGARLAGASRIVAVDMIADKLDLALKLGATDAVNASEVSATSSRRCVRSRTMVSTSSSMRSARSSRPNRPSPRSASEVPRSSSVCRPRARRPVSNHSSWRRRISGSLGPTTDQPFPSATSRHSSTRSCPATWTSPR